MKRAINIEGGKVERQAVDAVADAIVRVFTAAQDTNMDQSTVVAALGLVKDMGTVHDVSITNSHFEG